MPNRSDSLPVAVLGLGRFGQRIARQLSLAGEAVIACDKNREAVEQIAPHVAKALMLDVTDEVTIRSQGVHQTKVGVVAIGEDFEAAVLATVILKQLGVPRIIARARTATTADVLRRVGAHDVVLAEQEAADRWANRILGPRVLNQIEFHEGYSIIEFPAPQAWHGQGLAELDVRKRFNVHVVAIKRAEPGSHQPRIAAPAPADPIRAGDVLIIMGKDDGLRRLSEV